MPQQILALGLIAFFLIRLIKQKRKQQISPNEFRFWIGFWALASLAIIFIKTIDKFVAALGFSGSGINFLFYLAVMVLFYFIFKLRLKIVKLEKEITELTRQTALKDK